ncbi:hypothetical protein BIT28_09425 [Photobacterium proteolyticum]|uniref:Uncharacterized protein n=1 Tax=Photobacterium proteolyticum TaxID=1903952 RepID=A0A1Q9GIU9_9GAMM|nr:protein kinase [Photobacterium proteolyticum]OLQ74383.1 hypothetical protein BIT28_09425 [Photobacterium proteolyticum]
MNQAQGTFSTIEDRFCSNNYTILEKIGEGGFGQVYKARQISTQKLVAIKFLRLNEAESQQKKQRSIARFNRECDLVRRLNHPNIVSLIDKGQQGDGLLYAVYEYVNGETLKEHLDSQGPLLPADAAEIMACVLDALAHAHELGIVHRDIKPANIMLFKVGAKQHVKILDFGISTLKSDAKQTDFQTLTLNDEVLGTPKYSAPEQLRGEPSLPQTDIYVWGLVFIECLTGVSTIKGTSAATVFYHQLSSTNVPLGILAGHHSASFFRRVLHKKALERPGNTVDLYNEFQKLNFSDLVPSSAKLNNEAGDHATEILATQTGTYSSTYSRFIERKQISALCVILSEPEGTPDYITYEKQDIIEMLLADQHHQCVDIALRYGASQVGTIGDTTLFYFGYPVVSDNDSRLCARAALDIWNNLNSKQEQLFEKHGVNLELRIGLTKGMMRSIGGNLPEGRVATDAMSLARNAKPDEIVCSSQFQGMLSEQLIFEPQKDVSVPSSLQKYILKGERFSESFGFLRTVKSHGAMFGRQDAFDKLSLIDSPSSTTPLFHLYGDAGIGKSRLLLGLKESYTNTSVVTLQCLPEYKTNALYPILNLITAYFELNSPEADHHLTQAMSSLSAPLAERENCTAILRAWLQPYSRLSAYSEQLINHSLDNLSLNEQKKLLFIAISHLLSLISDEKQGDGHRTSTLFVCEDLHWADTTTIEFIRYFVASDWLAEHHIRWLNSSRNPLPDALVESTYSIVKLTTLTKSDCHSFIRYLLDSQHVSKKVEDLLTERSDGNPLFLEELVTYAQRNALIKKVNGQLDFVVSEPESQVPENLRESLQQKLDGLVFAKDTAQLAAAIGRTFSEQLIHAASDKDASQLQSDLEELQRANLIYIQRNVDGNQYQFKHALVRDAVYESTTIQPTIHSHIACAMEQNFNTGEYSAAMVAEQWAKAQRPSLAVPYYLQAGEQSSHSSIVEDAITYYEKALALSNEDISEHVSKKTKIQALIGLSDNLVRLAKHTQARQHYLAAIEESSDEDNLLKANLFLNYGKSLETHHLHEQAIEAYLTAESLLNADMLADKHWHQMWLSVQMAKLYVFYWRNQLQDMLSVINLIEENVVDFNNPTTKAKFYDAKLQYELRHTRYALTKQHVELAKHAFIASQETDDYPLQNNCLFTLGFTCLFSQQYTDAQQYLIQALKNATENADTTLKTRCLAYLTVLFRLQGNRVETRQYLRQAKEFAQNSGMDDYIAIANANEAWLAYKDEDYKHGQTLIEQCNHIWKALSNEFPFPLQWLALLIELELIASSVPLISQDITNHRVINIIKTILDSSQHALPASVINPLKEAINSRNIIGKQKYCQQSVLLALNHAKALGYL